MGKIMKEGKQYGVGGTQKASEITYGTGTVADALDTLLGTAILLGTATANNQTVTLADSITNYRYLLFTTEFGRFTLNSVLVPVNALTTAIIVAFNDGTVRKAQFDDITQTQFTIKNWENVNTGKVYGIK